jgi:taurine dioxygenase
MRVTLPGSSVAVGPVGYLAAERQRLDALRWEHFDVTRCSATVGAEVTGVDLTTSLPDPVITDLAAALADYKVLFFREQPMTTEQHVEFAHRFGELEVHPFLPANGESPHVVRFAKSAEVGGYENGWHHDVTWRETPSMGAILHAIDVPPSGGDTVFSDAYAALDGLDPSLRSRVDDLVAVHDFANVFGHTMSAEQRAEMREKYPVVEHPVVATHDVTGRDHLYVNRFFVDHLVGVDPDESVELVDQLSRSFELLEHQTRFRWEPHSVAFWDNRAVQHYACSDYWPDVRVMERASIVGKRPTRRG